jgi:hypothetical protein
MGNILRYFRIEGAPQEINDSTSSEGEIVWLDSINHHGSFT